MEPEIYLARLEGLVKDDLSRTELAQLEKLAQDTYTFVLAGGNVQKSQAGRSANRTREMLDPEMMESVYYIFNNEKQIFKARIQLKYKKFNLFF